MFASHAPVYRHRGPGDLDPVLRGLRAVNRDQKRRPDAPGEGDRTGDVQTGHVQTGDVQTGDVQTGDVQTGDVQTGDVQTGDVRRALQPGSRARHPGPDQAGERPHQLNSPSNPKPGPRPCWRSPGLLYGMTAGPGPRTRAPVPCTLMAAEKEGGGQARGSG